MGFSLSNVKKIKYLGLFVLGDQIQTNRFYMYHTDIKLFCLPILQMSGYHQTLPWSHIELALYQLYIPNEVDIEIMFRQSNCAFRNRHATFVF